MEHEEIELRKEKVKFRVALSLIVTLIVGGTILFHYLEGWNWIDSFYFTVATSATVGFGDVTPQTQLGRFCAALYILSIVPILLYSFTIIGEMHFGGRYKKVVKQKMSIYYKQHPEEKPEPFDD